MAEKYDQIGKDYNLSRSADLYLTRRFIALLNPQEGETFLEIGCGTGNYSDQFEKNGLEFTGIDPSAEMLDQAKSKNPNINWKIGTAEQTGLESESVNGIIACLTIHHWPDLEAAFKEQSRVLKNGGRLVLFTSTPEQMKGYWLNHYFPKMLQAGIDQMPSMRAIQSAMEKAGLTPGETESYSVAPRLEDLFLYSGKHNPGLYMYDQVRSGISTFSDLANAEEVTRGLEELRRDMDSGKIDAIIESYQNEHGDYLFMTAKKG